MNQQLRERTDADGLRATLYLSVCDAIWHFRLSKLPKDHKQFFGANVEEAPEKQKEAPPKTSKNKSNKNRKKPQKAGDESRAEKETTEEQKPVRQATAKNNNNKTNNATPQDEIEMLKKELEATKEKLKESERISENRKNRYSQLNEKWRLMKSTETGVAKEEGTEPTVTKTGTLPMLTILFSKTITQVSLCLENNISKSTLRL
mgnify:CR=1 FL=1